MTTEARVDELLQEHRELAGSGRGVATVEAELCELLGEQVEAAAARAFSWHPMADDARNVGLMVFWQMLPSLSKSFDRTRVPETRTFVSWVTKSTAWAAKVKEVLDHQVVALDVASQRVVAAFRALDLAGSHHTQEARDEVREAMIRYVVSKQEPGAHSSSAEARAAAERRLVRDGSMRAIRELGHLVDGANIGRALDIDELEVFATAPLVVDEEPAVAAALSVLKVKYRSNVEHVIATADHEVLASDVHDPVLGFCAFELSPTQFSQDTAPQQAAAEAVPVAALLLRAASL